MERLVIPDTARRILGFGAVVLSLVCINASAQAAPSKAEIAKALSTGIKPSSRFSSKTYVGSCRRAKAAVFWCNTCTASVKISSHGAPKAHYSSGADLMALRVRERKQPSRTIKIVGARRIDRLIIKGRSYKLSRKDDKNYNWGEYSVMDHDGPKIFARAKSWCEKRLK